MVCTTSIHSAKCHREINLDNQAVRLWSSFVSMVFHFTLPLSRRMPYPSHRCTPSFTYEKVSPYIIKKATDMPVKSLQLLKTPKGKKKTASRDNKMTLKRFIVFGCFFIYIYASFGTRRENWLEAWRKALIPSLRPINSTTLPTLISKNSSLSLSLSHYTTSSGVLLCNMHSHPIIQVNCYYLR